jgi:multiple sugar transport system permease protein
MKCSDETNRFFKGMAFLSPWLIGVTLFTVLPILLSLYYSFCDFPLVQPPIFTGLDNYRQLLHDSVFWEVLGNSLYYISLSIPLGLVMSLSVALLLNRRIPGQGIFRTIIYLPSLIPSAAMAMLWLWLLNQKQGLINMYLTRIPFLHITGPGWLTDEHWVIPAFVMIGLWSMGNTVVIYLAGLQDVPKELYEAADLDGANSLHRLWHVTLPMISPVIFFNLIVAIIGALNIVDLPYIMTQGLPGHSSDFLSYYLYRNTFMYNTMGKGCAMAWVQLTLVLILTALAFWSSRRWVYYQGK